MGPDGAVLIGVVTRVGLVVGLGASSALAASVHLLNVSYDPTREFYRELNVEFAREWKAKTGTT